MHIIHSFWTKPMQTGPMMSSRNSQHMRKMLLNWIVSTNCALEVYGNITLYTDTLGAELLVGELGLPYSAVHSVLDEIQDIHPGLWAFGKLYTYSIQTKPFIHIDGDVFLWKPLPEKLINKEIFVQFPELGQVFTQYYTTPLKMIMEQAKALPPYWLLDLIGTARATGTQAPLYDYINPENALNKVSAYNCGILGTNNINSIKKYARDAMDIVTNEKNAEFWNEIFYSGKYSGDEISYFNLIIEQYHLGAFCRTFKVDTGTLFKSNWMADYSTLNTQRLGFSHNYGNMKFHPGYISSLEDIAREHYPDSYNRLNSMKFY